MPRMGTTSPRTEPQINRKDPFCYLIKLFIDSCDDIFTIYWLVWWHFLQVVTTLQRLNMRRKHPQRLSKLMKWKFISFSDVTPPPIVYTLNRISISKIILKQRVVTLPERPQTVGRVRGSVLSARASPEMRACACSVNFFMSDGTGAPSTKLG